MELTFVPLADTATGPFLKLLPRDWRKELQAARLHAQEMECALISNENGVIGGAALFAGTCPEKALANEPIVADLCAGNAIYLGFFYVKKAERGKGYGRKLMEACSKLHGDVPLWVLCKKSLVPWYCSLGFTEKAKLRDGRSDVYVLIKETAA